MLKIFLIAALLVVVTRTAHTQTFPIAVDATGLSWPSTLVDGGEFSTSSAHIIALTAGTHTLNYGTGASSPGISFDVSSSGILSYAPALEGLLAGAGTSMLAVNGVPVVVDLSPLSVSSVYLYGLGSVAPQVLNLHLLPVVHTIEYANSDVVEFAVDLAGLVSYDPTLEGILLGAGGSVLVVDGAQIIVDLSPLSVPAVYIYGFDNYPTDTLALNVLPGSLSIQYTTTQVYVTIDNAGNVGYDVALEGILHATNAYTVVANGAELFLDLSELSALTLYLYSFGFQPSDVLNLRLLPGEHSLDYTDTGSPFLFTIATDGSVSYDSSWEGIVSLNLATETLAVHGLEVFIATGGESLWINALDFVDSCAPLRLMPGGHGAYSPLGDGSFDVLFDGTVDYAPALDSQWTGAGTNTIKYFAGGGQMFECPGPFTRGDANGDGTLMISDAVSAISYLFYDGSPPCLDSLDADDNGVIGVSDVLQVLCYLFCPGMPSPPSPFPECGLDPSQGVLSCHVYDGCS